MKATILNYEKTLFYIKNTHASNALKYSIMLSPDGNLVSPTWHIILSGVSLTAGVEGKHKLSDPWDVAKFQTMNNASGTVATCVAYINRK